MLDSQKAPEGIEIKTLGINVENSLQLEALWIYWFILLELLLLEP